MNDYISWLMMPGYVLRLVDMAAVIPDESTGNLDKHGVNRTQLSGILAHINMLHTKLI